MQGKKFYLKTFITISVFSFFISYCIYGSTTYLKENVENVLSTGSYQHKRNAAVMASNAETNHESLLNKYVSNKNTKKYSNKYLNKIDGRKLRRELFAIRSTTPVIEKSTKYAVLKQIHNLTKHERDKRTTFLNSLKLSRIEIHELEQRTKGQRENEEWVRERKKRLTSFAFGKAARVWTEEAKDRYVYFLVHGRKTKANSKYNEESEKKAKKQLQEVLGREISDAGLMIDYHLPFLAASPDGFVGNNGLIEIKIPPEAQNMTPQAAVIGRKIRYCRMLNGRLHLKRQSNQYYQIQGQMHISTKSYCYFCIWTPKGLMFELIRRNDTFWERKLEKPLQLFYLQNLMPELVRNLPPSNLL